MTYSTKTHERGYVDSIEVYYALPGKRILYRPRIWVEYYQCMVEISGDHALFATPQAAWNYAREWQS